MSARVSMPLSLTFTISSAERPQAQGVLEGYRHRPRSRLLTPTIWAPQSSARATSSSECLHQRLHVQLSATRPIRVASSLP